MKSYVFIVLLLLIICNSSFSKIYCQMHFPVRTLKLKFLLITFKFQLLHDVGNVHMFTLQPIMPIEDDINPLNDCLILNILDTFINLV